MLGWQHVQPLDARCMSEAVSYMQWGCYRH